MLADRPGLGQARPDIASQLRYSLVGRYLTLYREIESGIEIVRVVLSARHLPNTVI